jgi:hypothetical protein
LRAAEAKANGSKEVRAASLVAHCAFQFGKYKDQVDAAAGAFVSLAYGPQSNRDVVLGYDAESS